MTSNPQSDVFAINYSVFDANYNPTPPGGGGSGDVLLGGQNGPVTIGTIDNTDFNLISGGAINIGDSMSCDTIHLNGSVAFQYDEIKGVSSYNLTENNYFINVTDPMTTDIYLPLSSTSLGRQYIINKGYLPGVLTIRTTGIDSIDSTAETEFQLFEIINAKVTMIADGENNWLVL